MKRLTILIMMFIIGACIILGIYFVTKYQLRESTNQNSGLKISNISLFVMSDVDGYTFAPFKKIVITYDIKNKTEYEVLDYKLVVEMDYLDCTEKTLKETITQYHDNPILPNEVQIAQIVIKLPKEKCSLQVGDVRIHIVDNSITKY